MTKLNAFHKDLLVLFGLLALQLIFSFFFPLTNETIGNLVITQNFGFLTLEADGNSYTYVPILPVIYALITGALLLKQEKPLTLIYGLGLMLLTKVNFISQLFQLEGANTNVVFGSRLTKTILIDDRMVAQDLTLYIVLFLIAIKGSIVAYQTIEKRFFSKQETQPNPKHKAA